MRNRKGLPGAVDDRKELHDTEFFFKQDTPVMCASYRAKKKKNVLLVSTKHDEGTINLQCRKRKPESVLLYNKKRCGVDAYNKKLREMSSQPQSYNWTVHVFTLIVDMCLLNAHTVFSQVVSDISRRDHAQIVVDGLVCDWMEQRYNGRHQAFLQQDTVAALEEVLGMVKTDFVPTAVSTKERGKPAKCYLCLELFTRDSEIDAIERKRLKKNLRKIKSFCTVCDFPVCKLHRHLRVCVQCSSHRLHEE